MDQTLGVFMALSVYGFACMCVCAYLLACALQGLQRMSTEIHTAMQTARAESTANDAVLRQRVERLEATVQDCVAQLQEAIERLAETSRTLGVLRHDAEDAKARADWAESQMERLQEQLEQFQQDGTQGQRNSWSSQGWQEWDEGSWH